MSHPLLERLTHNGKIVNSFNNQGITKNIWRSSPYWWLTIGGEQIQSIVNEQHPTQPILPVPQAMLMWLLWRNLQLPTQVLNLGMGAGTIERALSLYPLINVTSVESSQQVIDIAHQYFQLPHSSNIKHACALEYVESIVKNQLKKIDETQLYDVIMVDLFERESIPAMLCDSHFYMLCKKLLTVGGILVVNLYVSKDIKLLAILSQIRAVFQCKLVVGFTDFGNIVLIMSHAPLPTKSALQARLSSKRWDLINFTHAPELRKHLYFIE